MANSTSGTAVTTPDIATSVSWLMLLPSVMPCGPWPKAIIATAGTARMPASIDRPGKAGTGAFLRTNP
jgi:hypothetical protein